MSFRVILTSDSLHVEPGIAASVSLEIVNEGPSSFNLNIQVEGIDPAWVAVPVPELKLGSNETRSERIFLKPPREPESLAGTYPFVVKVWDPESGESRTVQATLEIKPYHQLSVDVQPRRAILSTFSRRATFQATVINLGNVEHNVRMSATDPDDLFAFEFDSEEALISPGAQKTFNLTTIAKKPALFANARLQQFNVSCRSSDRKTVAATANGLIEQRALITPSVLALCVMAITIIASFFFFLPKQPVVDILTIDKARALTEEEFDVKWSASNAKSVTIVFNGEQFPNLPVSGSKSFSIDQAGDFEILVTAVRGLRVSSEKIVKIAIREPEPIPEPVIEFFSIEPTELYTGQFFTVHYRLNDAVTHALLDPRGLALDLDGERVELEAKIVGEFEYKLIARNAAGEIVTASQNIVIRQGSKATIVVFRADPPIVDPFEGLVTLTWQLTNAFRIELIVGDNDPIVIPPEEMTGGRVFPVTEDTTFKLIGYDDVGATIEQEITVTVNDPDDFF